MAAHGLRWERTAQDRADYRIQELRDRDAIREILRARVEYTAYALGQLEPGLF